MDPLLSTGIAIGIELLKAEMIERRIQALAAKAKISPEALEAVRKEARASFDATRDPNTYMEV